MVINDITVVILDYFNIVMMIALQPLSICNEISCYSRISQGSADFHRDSPITSSTPSPPPSTPPPVCSLASSAQQFMQRKRQAAEQENMQQTECPELERI